ncbi:hypothetical protein [Aquimarina brevivitae]|uniref:Secreted protein n=1 Tax=Aquimarina brevivitae TaxID=323412 RepID=A0A4V2F5P2_9FLAO|nr:hypothetical protein [Aquimarina brevivitae]RZS93509.1 hypothetical protein EV197_2088 [Aquimarina brevivitae]
MKTIKLLAAILFFSPLFIACEADSVENEDVSLEIIDVFGNEDESDDTTREYGTEDESDDTVRG